jgi:hypothetical protein
MARIDGGGYKAPGVCPGTSAIGRWGGWLLSAGLCVLAAGCATSADPHEGGFVSGVVGLAGGGYQRRVDEREGVHQGELDAQQRLKAQARALEQERTQVRGELARAQARLAGQERRIAEQRSRLRAEGKSPAAQASLRQLDQAQARLATTKGELRGVRPDDQPVTDLKTKSQGIHKELDEIDSMVSVVSGSRF